MNKQPEIILNWEKENAKGKLPLERGFHTSTIVSGTKIFYTGGDAKNTYFKDILMYDTITAKWAVIKNPLPNARSGHSCNIYNNKLYIYGGKFKHKYLSSLIILDLVTYEWIKPKFSHENLIPRGAHSASIINNYLYIYGGLTPTEDGSLTYLSDMIIFDLMKEKWIIPTIEGSIPYGRAGHTGTVVGKDIFVFGGRSGSLLLHDSYLFSTTKLSWIKIHPSGNIPSARAGHTIENFDDNSLILFGGSNWTLFFSSIFIFNLEKAEWREIELTGEIPEPRIWHTSSIIGLKMYIFGGGNEKSLFKNVYSLDLFPLKNKEIEMEKNIKIKTVHKDETRAFLFPMNFNYEDLMSKLSGEYQQTNISINYIDEEDETITICSNEELFEATEFFKNNGKSLRFLIKINDKFNGTNKETENSFVQINEESKMTKTKEDRVKAVIGDLLGAGAFGRVYLGMNINNGGLIAIKQIPIKGNKNKKTSALKEVIKEINLMKSLNHENIVRYLGAEESNEYLQIYLEYVSGGSIQQLLSKFKKFQESVVILYTKQILSGLKYLHDNDIIHRDIKGGNILLTENGVIKLADFGHSKSLNELDSKKSYKGTPFWMSPEIARNFQYSKSSDIWALGCTIVEMLTGKPPYPKLLHLTNPLEIIAEIRKEVDPISPTIPDNISKELKKLLTFCFQRDPKDRPSVDKLLVLLEEKEEIKVVEEYHSSTIDILREIEEESPQDEDYFETYSDGSYQSPEEKATDEESEEEEEDQEEEDEEEEEEEEEEKILDQKSSRYFETLRSINQQMNNLELRSKKSKIQPILQLSVTNETLADKNDIINFLLEKQKKQNRSIKSFQTQNQKSFNYYN